MIILDVLMPPGSLFQGEDTEYGLTTGIKFYKKIREILPKCPVVIWTNMGDVRISEYFSGESMCWLLRKEDYLPFEFVVEVERILRSVGKAV
jgi:hypothetical protein